MALHRAIASFVALEGHRPPGSNGLVVDLRQDRDQNPKSRTAGANYQLSGSMRLLLKPRGHLIEPYPPGTTSPSARQICPASHDQSCRTEDRSGSGTTN